jgi:hypothetical protein
MNEHLSYPNHSEVPNPAIIEQQKWNAVFEAVGGLGLHFEANERASQVGALTGATLMEAATRLHTALVPEVSHEPTEKAMHVQGPDGDNRRTLVEPGERAGLYDLAADLVGRLNAGRKAGEEEAFLKRAANLVALSLVLAHPFQEGNGRTARTLAHVMREGYGGGDQIQDDIRVVGSNRPASGYRLHSYVPTKEGVSLSPQDLLIEAASIDIPLAKHDEYVSKSRSYFTTPYGGD